MSFAYELGRGSFRAGNRVYSASFNLVSIMNTYERDKFTNVIYQVSGYWVDNEKAEEKEIPEKKIEFCIRGVIRNEDSIGPLMIRVMNWSDNLMILMDSEDQIGELELPYDIPDAVKKITYINGGE